MVRAYLGLGSNLGDRVGYIQQAVRFLNDADGIEVIETSSFYETEPIGMEAEKWFVNAIVEIETVIEPDDLIDITMDIEKKLDRVRDANMSKDTYLPRTIDIDILFYGDEIYSSEKVQIPHPRVHERAYALVPMLELNPHFVHPVIQRTMVFIHQTLLEPEEVYLYGTRREE